jgi:lipopolysaccharide heptosyltransferase II
METHADPWEAHQRLLCVRLDTIGDVLMTTPALCALREQRPDRQIALLTSRPGAQAAALVPEIDRTIVYDAPWMKAPVTDPSPWRDCAMVEQLRAGDFDAAVIFATYSQSPLPAALTCHLAGIPRVLAHCRENPYRLISDWVPEPEPESGVRHEVRRHLDLVASVGAVSERAELSLDVPHRASVGALRALREAGHDPNRPWLLVQPGATAESRRYPVEHYAEAMRRLADETGSRIVVSGDVAERALVEGLVAALGDRAVALAGKLSFPELCALIAAAPLLVCGNTGPAHVAAAVGTPVVVLYALTNPQHAPWGSPARVLTHDVPCRWCLGSVCREGHHDCLRRIEPDEVVEAAMTLLTGARPGAEAAMPTPPPPVVLGADQAALGLAAP